MLSRVLVISMTVFEIVSRPYLREEEEVRIRLRVKAVSDEGVS